MDQGLATVIGMSIAYVASFVGMALAWYGWRRRREEGGARGGAGGGPAEDGSAGGEA